MDSSLDIPVSGHHLSRAFGYILSSPLNKALSLTRIGDVNEPNP